MTLVLWVKSLGTEMPRDLLGISIGIVKAGKKAAHFSTHRLGFMHYSWRIEGVIISSPSSG